MQVACDCALQRQQRNPPLGVLPAGIVAPPGTPAAAATNLQLLNRLQEAAPVDGGTDATACIDIEQMRTSANDVSCSTVT